MAKVLFKTDGIVNGKVVFKAGEVYEISNELGSVSRWVKRGAEVVSEETVVADIVDNTEVTVQEETKEETVQEEIKEEIKDETEVESPEVLPGPGPEEEVVKETPKKENKKGKKS